MEFSKRGPVPLVGDLCDGVCNRDIAAACLEGAGSDTGCTFAAGGCNSTAGDGDVAAACILITTVSDTGSTFAAGGCNSTAVDGDVAAARIITASDTGVTIATRGSNITAVDRDIAAAYIGTASDTAGRTLRRSIKRAIAVDREGFSYGNINARIAIFAASDGICTL